MHKLLNLIHKQLQNNCWQYWTQIGTSNYHNKISEKELFPSEAWQAPATEVWPTNQPSIQHIACSSSFASEHLFLKKIIL